MDDSNPLNRISLQQVIYDYAIFVAWFYVVAFLFLRQSHCYQKKNIQV